MYKCIINFPYRIVKKEQVPVWDIFQMTNKDNTHNMSTKCYTICTKVTKALVYSLLFVLVFVTALVSKYSLVVMTNGFRNENGRVSILLLSMQEIY